MPTSSIAPWQQALLSWIVAPGTSQTQAPAKLLRGSSICRVSGFPPPGLGPSPGLMPRLAALHTPARRLPCQLQPYQSLAVPPLCPPGL